MCILNNNPYVRKIKTWRKDVIKYKENYYLRKTGTWIFCLGLNPSQTFSELIDVTNLKLCNYFISNSLGDKKVKGYTLLNFSNVAKTESDDLVSDDFDEKHIKYINFALSIIIKKKTHPVVFFYGRKERNKMLINKIIDEKFKNNVDKLIEANQLYITTNTREFDGKDIKNINFDKFTHPANAGIGNDLGIRLATKDDIKDLF